MPNFFRDPIGNITHDVSEWLEGRSENLIQAATTGNIAPLYADVYRGWMYGLYAAALIMGGQGNYWGAVGAGALASLVGGELADLQQNSLPPRIDFDRSPTYSWSPQTIQQQGGVVPRVYGRMQVCGNVISADIHGYELNEEKQHLHLLLALGDGPITSIESIRINSRPVSEIASSVSYWTRPGTLDQPAIPAVATRREYATGLGPMTLGAEQQYTTPNSDCREFEIDLAFPQGLCLVGADGKLSRQTATFLISYKPAGGSKTAWKTINVAAASRSPRVHTVNMVLPAVGQYTIYVKLISWGSTPTEYSPNIVQYAAVRECLHDVLCYPGTALVGITALANEVAAGALTAEVVVRGRPCRIWDGSTWTISYTDNPAWIVYDILTRPVITGTTTITQLTDYTGEHRTGYQESFSVSGLTLVRLDGYQDAQLDVATFKAWADYCDELIGGEKRFSFAGVFDTASSVWETARQIAAHHHAILIHDGATVRAVVDRLEGGTDAPLISMGNIIEGSYCETLLPMTDRPSSVDAEYLDAASGYSRQILHLAAGGSQPNDATPARLQLLGITDATRAWRAARRALLFSQHVTRQVEFQMDIDGIGLSVGQIIRVQHDLASDAVGGRIVSATSTTITLDRSITLQAGQTYTIQIRSDDGSVQSRTVSTGAGTWTTIAVAPALSPVPSIYAPYALGVAPSRLYRITSIETDADLRRRISATEYSAAAYAADVEIPAPSEIAPISYSTEVAGCSLQEEMYADSEGEIHRRLVIRWSPAPRLSRCDIIIDGSRVGTVKAPSTSCTVDASGFAQVDHEIRITPYFANPVGFGTRELKGGTTVLTYTPAGQDLSDRIFSVSEKVIARRDWQAIAGTQTTPGEYATLKSQADQYPGDTGIQAALTSYVAAYLALGTWLNGGSAWVHNPSQLPAYINGSGIRQATVVSQSGYVAAATEYQRRRGELQNALHARAATTALWTGVSGTERPDDNATKNSAFSGADASKSGVSARPGDTYYATDTKKLYTYNGSVWIETATSGAPAGTLVGTLPAESVQTQINQAASYYPSTYLQDNDPFPLKPTLTRASTACTTLGLQVSANDPRIERGKFGTAILVESQATNLITYANDFAHSSWNVNAGGLTITAGHNAYPLSVPGGATKISEDGGNNYHCRGVTPANSGVVRRFSIKAKAAERKYMRGHSWAGGDTSGQWFNLETGICGGSLNPRMKALGGGWWLCSFDVPAPHNNTVCFGPASDTAYNTTSPYQGTSGYGIYVCDAQLETTPYETSIIRTSGSTATRATDVLTIPTAGVLKHTAGTVEAWVWHDPKFEMVMQSRPIFSTWATNAVNNCIYLYCYANNIYGRIWGGNSISQITSPTPLIVSAWNHVAVTWTQSTLKLYVNGAQVGNTITLTDPLTAIGSVAHLGSVDGTNQIFGSLIDDVRITPRERTAAEILASYQSLTGHQLDADTTALLRFDAGVVWRSPSSNLVRVWDGTKWIDGATKNIVTYASTAPGSPMDGDLWCDISVNPNVWKVRVGGVWQTAANLTTNTNQLTDGAGLGTTALWTGIGGEGKPDDNATKNSAFSGTDSGKSGVSARPGDTYYATDTGKLYTYNGSVWLATVDRTQTTIDGGMVTTGRLEVGSGTLGSVNAGVSGVTTGAVTVNNSPIRFWAGSTYANSATSASFYVTDNGTLRLGNSTKNLTYDPTNGLVVNGDIIATGNIVNNAITNSNYTQIQSTIISSYPLAHDPYNVYCAIQELQCILDVNPDSSVLITMSPQVNIAIKSTVNYYLKGYLGFLLAYYDSDYVKTGDEFFVFSEVSLQIVANEYKVFKTYAQSNATSNDAIVFIPTVFSRKIITPSSCHQILVHYAAKIYTYNYVNQNTPVSSYYVTYFSQPVIRKYSWIRLEEFKR